jgi:hypothetical protein
MSRVSTLALAAALSLLAVPAFAASNHQDGVAVKHECKHKKFPMPAAEFRQHVAARQEKARIRMEGHLAKKQLPKDKADEVRARFATAAALVFQKVDAVCTDGTVTKEEAKEVRALAKSLHFHHKDHPARN